jgi:hypothetical protein
MIGQRGAWMAGGVLAMALLLFWASPVSPVLAQQGLSDSITDQYTTAGDKAGLSGEKKPQQLIAEAIKIMLSVTGMMFFALIVFAGYVRVTSHGEEDRVKKSTSTAVAAFLGLMIVLVSYGITVFVTSRLSNATTYEPQYEENNEAPNTTYDKTIDLKLFN